MILDFRMALKIFLGVVEVDEHVIHLVGLACGIELEYDVFQLRELFADFVMMFFEYVYVVACRLAAYKRAYVGEYFFLFVGKVLFHLFQI